MLRSSSVFNLARLVAVDGLRRHALLGLLVFALAAQAAGLLFFEFIPREVGRASVDFVFSVLWLVGVIFIFFHAVQVIAWDEEKRLIHTYLARPICRSEYVLGVFFGLGYLLLLLNLILCTVGWTLLVFIRSSVESLYFPHLSFPNFLLTAFGILLLQITLLSVIMFFSALIRGSFTVLIVVLSYFFICNGLPVVREVFALQQGGSFEIPTANYLLATLGFFFPDFSRMDFRDLIILGDSVDLTRALFVDFGVFVAYIIVVVWIACSLYEKRDLK
jgi:Cu-processing system permease protein